ncbi:MAG: hypothetical protein ACKO0M_08520 [Cyanobium sp.]
MAEDRARGLARGVVASRSAAASWADKAIKGGPGGPIEAPQALVIGIGNRLRGDDGVGFWLAERAEGLQLPVKVKAVHQLTPELVDDLAGAARVLFIDAWIVGGRLAERTPAAADVPGTAHARASAGAAFTDVAVSGVAFTGASLVAGDGGEGEEGSHPVLQPLAVAGDKDAPPVTTGLFSHALDSGCLLALTQLLHGSAPAAWQLLLPAYRCEPGEGFSPQLSARLNEAEAMLRQWCEGLCMN